MNRSTLHDPKWHLLLIGHHWALEPGDSFAAQRCDSIESAVNLLAAAAFDLILVDCRPLAIAQLQPLLDLMPRSPWTRLVVFCDSALVAQDALAAGADDYILDQVNLPGCVQLLEQMARRLSLEKAVAALQSDLAEADLDTALITADPAMTAVMALAMRVAQSRAHLVIRGESGTGKVHLARLIHAWSDRADNALALEICRTDPEHHLDQDLFGRGGKVEIANGGSLLLIEIAALPLPLQPRLLRLLKDREFERPDDPALHHSDARVLATTSVDLRQAIADGTFREDLAMALNVVQIDVPPLRERRQDIAPLAVKYLQKLAQRMHKPATDFSDQAMHVLRQYDWPGNLRELRNIVERAVILSKGDTVTLDHLPANLLNMRSDITIGDLVPLATVEEAHVRKVVQSARSMRQAAAILGVDTGTVTRRMKRYTAKS